MPVLPDWVLFHAPHDSTIIPPSKWSKLLLSNAELKAELLRMTDHWTFDLFAEGIPERRVLRSPVSRLVDMERYEDFSALRRNEAPVPTSGEFFRRA
jgi:hypothetical protein